MENDQEIERFAFTSDEGVGARARLGLLVLASDLTIEDEFRALTDLPGVAVYHARLKSGDEVTPETLVEMADELPKAAALLPEYLSLSAIGYGCTSASTIIGEEKVADIIGGVHPGVPTTNPLTAAKAALGALGIKRLGLLTPYTPDVTEAMRDKFQQAGIDVPFVGSFYEKSEAAVGRIDETSVLDATLKTGSSEQVDGVFISCTNLRSLSIITKAEATLGKPVTASNHALAWHLLRLSGVEDAAPKMGRLFQKQL